MERNKGITLIVLIVTIIILLILAGITIMQLTGENGLLNKTKRSVKQYEIGQAKEELQIKVNTLQMEQQSKGEELTKEDLPKLNNDKIDVGSTESFPVQVIYGKYKFQIDENFIVTYIGEESGTIVTYITQPEGYTNQDEVKILINMSNPNGIKTIEQPNGNKLNCYGKTTVGIDYKVNKNGSYIFKIIDSENNSTTKDIFIDLIDKLEPKDFEISINNGIQVGDNVKFSIVADAEDAEATEESTKSGIDYYEYYIIDKDGIETKYDTKEITIPIGDDLRIYVIAYDKAGNSKKSNIIDVDIEKLIKGIQITPSTTNWTKDDVSIEVDWGYTEEGIKKEISIDGGETYTEYIEPVSVGKNTTVIAKMTTSIGEITKELKITNIDKIEPNSFTPTVSDLVSSTELLIYANTSDAGATDEYGCSGIKEYKYYVYQGETLIDSATVATESWTASSLTVGETYDIYVEACDNAGNIKKSEILSYEKLNVYVWEMYEVKNTRKVILETYTMDYSYQGKNSKTDEYRLVTSDPTDLNNWHVNQYIYNDVYLSGVDETILTGLGALTTGKWYYHRLTNSMSSAVVYKFSQIGEGRLEGYYAAAEYIVASEGSEYSKNSEKFLGIIKSNNEEEYPQNGATSGTWYELVSQ